VKKQVDLVMRGARGAGVTELIGELLDNDLKPLRRRPKSGVRVGTDPQGNDLCVPVYGTRVLVTGESAGGKSQLALAVLSQLMKMCYQTCVVDPEGDYQGLRDAVVLGTIQQTPVPEEVIQVLKD